LLAFPPDVTMLDSMAPNGPNRARIGIPWRTSQEEAEGNLPKIRYYMEAVRKAGGEPILLSLAHPESLEGQLRGWMVLSCPEAQPTLSRANTAP